jgi:HD-GYP domain-containing protein (c-di-GMP phosphodiesterase class II)
MLKQIPLNKIRLGMFIQEMQGTWMNHPFWRKSFKLENIDDLKKIVSSSLSGVVIDTDKGLDVLEPAEPKPANENAIKADIVLDTPSTPATKITRVTAAEERERAAKIIKSSKSAVSSMFKEIRMGRAINTEGAMALVEEIANSVSRNEGALISLVRLKDQDDYTYMHSVAVCALMVALAKELDLSEAETRQAGLAGLVHDIGKVAISLDILNKPGKLTDEEFDKVKLHPVRGHEYLLQSVGIDEVALDVCLHHHEKVDGSGYPDKLAGDKISLFAKMGAVCDVYDAITSNRPYKEGWEPGVSLQRMAQWSKTHFDDVVFKAFVKSVGIYPIGSMVLMKSGRLGVVTDQSPKSLLTPIVKVFFSIRSKMRIPVEILDLSKPSAHDEIIKHDDPAAWGITDINDVWTQ